MLILDIKKRITTVIIKWIISQAINILNTVINMLHCVTIIYGYARKHTKGSQKRRNVRILRLCFTFLIPWIISFANSFSMFVSNYSYSLSTHCDWWTIFDVLFLAFYLTGTINCATLVYQIYAILKWTVKINSRWSTTKSEAIIIMGAVCGMLISFLGGFLFW